MSRSQTFACGKFKDELNLILDFKTSFSFCKTIQSHTAAIPNQCATEYWCSEDYLLAFVTHLLLWLLGDTNFPPHWHYSDP